MATGNKHDMSMIMSVLAQPLQFAAVGATGMFLDLSVFAILLHLSPAPFARALAIWIAMTWNFWLNRRVTFADSRNRPILRQYALFCLSCALGAVVSWSVFVALHSAFALFVEWPVVPAFLGIVLGTALNFILSKFVAFK